LIGCTPDGRILFILGPIPGRVNDDVALLSYLQDPDSEEGKVIRAWILGLPADAAMVLDAGMGD